MTLLVAATLPVQLRSVMEWNIVSDDLQSRRVVPSLQNRDPLLQDLGQNEHMC